MKYKNEIIMDGSDRVIKNKGKIERIFKYVNELFSVDDKVVKEIYVRGDRNYIIN